MTLSKTKKVFAENTEHPLIKSKRGNKRLSKARRKQLNKLSGLFVISRALQNYFIEQQLCADKVHVSNMFVDASRFDIKRTVSGQRYFAYCGVVSKYKDGVDVLLNAFAMFHKHHPEYKLYITSVALIFRNIL